MRISDWSSDVCSSDLRNQVQLGYFCGETESEEFQIDGREVCPVYSKAAHHDFLDRTFVKERRIWLPLGDFSEESRLSIWIGGRERPTDRKSTRLNSSHYCEYRMPYSA